MKLHDLYCSMIKHQFGLFLFSKIWKYHPGNTNEDHYLRLQFTLRVLCLSVRPWDSSQNREPHGKTVSFCRSAKDLRKGHYSINQNLVIAKLAFFDFDYKSLIFVCSYLAEIRSITATLHLLYGYSVWCHRKLRYCPTYY